MLEDDGYGKLGFYSNASIYFGLGLGSLVSTGVMNTIGDIKTMALGAFLSVPFMASFIFPSLKDEHPELDGGFWFSEGFVYATMIFFSLVNGIGEAILFVASGKYLSECATVRNKGFIFGYYWAFYMSS